MQENMNKNIKINAAFNQILVYNENYDPIYVNSNVSEYDIHPWHTANCFDLPKIEAELGIKFPYRLMNDGPKKISERLGQFHSQTLFVMLDNTFDTFKICELNEIHPTGKYYIYPIVLHTDGLFRKYTTIDLDERVVDSIKKKLCKIVILQLTEGFFSQYREDILWVSSLASKYNFEKEDIVVLTSNLISNENYNRELNLGNIIDNFTIFQYIYFRHSIWFRNDRNTLNEHVRNSMSTEFNWFLEQNKEYKKIHHFLCFNRIVKPHRIAIFGEIMTNEMLKDKSIVSMGGNKDANPSFFYDLFNSWFNDSYKSKDRISKFFTTYDSRYHYIYDESDLENNKAESFNIDAHSTSFVNIVTESLINERTVFFSEKTFKPMQACQPFIMIGNPYSLKKLKEYGFKTFSDWWDESYDDETDISKRMQKIVELMEEISTWSLDKCFEITNEMSETLTHNFNTLINNDETFKLHTLISDQKNII